MFKTNHYKSWSHLNKQLNELLCDDLKNYITYFLTRYHDVHNSYGRAVIRYDQKELINFSFIDMYKRDNDMNDVYELTGKWEETKEVIDKWNKEAIYSDYDFLKSATAFLQMPIKEALISDDYIIRIFAIMDRRVGKRTLSKIKEEGSYRTLPEWIRGFYMLRLGE